LQIYENVALERVSIFRTLSSGGEIWKSFAVHNLERVSIHYAFSLIYTTTSSFNTTPGCVVCGNLITVTLFSEKNTAILLLLFRDTRKKDVEQSVSKVMEFQG
jgi:hypothetical protein